MSRTVVRRLAALAADERGDYNERVNAALEACRRIVRGRLLGEEEYEKPSSEHRVRRVDGPLYLRREDPVHGTYVFVFWRSGFSSYGIADDLVGELVLVAGACTVMWMTDGEKLARLGCCPSQPVAAWVDVAVSG